MEAEFFIKTAGIRFMDFEKVSELFREVELRLTKEEYKDRRSSK
jgi:hypothetical protein